jgi:phosphatidate cytidylyltransferase
MKTRILSAFIMLPLMAVIYFGGLWLVATCFAIGILGVREFFKGFESLEIKPSFPIAVVSTIGLYGIFLLDGKTEWFLCWGFLSVLLSLLYLFDIEKRKLEDAMATITGIFYVVYFSFHVVLVENTGNASILVWLIVLSAFGSDVMAYFTGMAIGRHKLCPKISPKKTIEGAIGGVLGSILFCGVFGFYFANQYFFHCLAIGAIGATISQCGDLTASIFKRKMGIKDYGNLIPGHGGILDRFDSVLFTAPAIYYYIHLFII